jgi:ABC-type polysaccharide/polyol phosphate export permease
MAMLTVAMLAAVAVVVVVFGLGWGLDDATLHFLVTELVGAPAFSLLSASRLRPFGAGAVWRAGR